MKIFSQIYPYTVEKDNELETILYCFLIVTIMLLLYILKNKKRKISKSNTTPLTKQELKIIRLIFAEKTNQEISQNLFISVSTVKTHINNIFRKLNVNSKEELKSLKKIIDV